MLSINIKPAPSQSQKQIMQPRSLKEWQTGLGYDGLIEYGIGQSIKSKEWIS